MRGFKVNKRVKNTLTKTVASILTITFMLQVATPILAFGNQYQNIDTTIYVTEESLDDVWDSLFDEEYEDYEFEFTEEGLDAFWDRVFEEAYEYVESYTDKEWAEIEREFEERQEEEAEFLSNLSPESLWESYVDANPEVQDMNQEAIESLQEDIQELYEVISHDEFDVMIQEFYESFGDYEGTVVSRYQGIQATSAYSITGGAVAAWTNNFSIEDGLNFATRRAIELTGSHAAVEANRFYGNNAMRQDAFRHYGWNFRASIDMTVGANLTARRNNARIFTTNRELASIIIRRDPNLNTTNITAARERTGRQVRQTVLSLSRASWHSATNASNSTRDDLMDLWNNHWGRHDAGVSGASLGNIHSRFVTRWNGNGALTGIQRTNTTMTLARRNHLFDNRWHRPR